MEGCKVPQRILFLPGACTKRSSWHAQRGPRGLIWTRVLPSFILCAQSVAMSSDDSVLAAGDATGRVLIWRDFAAAVPADLREGVAAGKRRAEVCSGACGSCRRPTCRRWWWLGCVQGRGAQWGGSVRCPWSARAAYEERASSRMPGVPGRPAACKQDCLSHVCAYLHAAAQRIQRASGIF